MPRAATSVYECSPAMENSVGNRIRRHRPGATVFVCLLTAFIFAINGGVLLVLELDASHLSPGDHCTASVQVVIPVLAQEFSVSTEVAAWANLAPGFMAALIGLPLFF